MKAIKNCLEYEETDKRNDDCAWYETCLNRAAQMRMKSFVCTGCEYYIGGYGLDIEDFMVRRDVPGPKPLGDLGNWKKTAKGLSARLRKNGIIMLNFREAHMKK